VIVDRAGHRVDAVFTLAAVAQVENRFCGPLYCCCVDIDRIAVGVDDGGAAPDSSPEKPGTFGRCTSSTGEHPSLGRAAVMLPRNEQQ